MKTNINDFAKRIDDIIPEATPESVKGQCRCIRENVKTTGRGATATLMCLAGTAYCASCAFQDSVMLGLMISKTTTKKIFNGVKDFYSEIPATTVYR